MRQKTRPAKPAPPRKKNPHAQALAKLGASKGGKARWAGLSAEERSAILRKAALARWGKRKGGP